MDWDNEFRSRLLTRQPQHWPQPLIREGLVTWWYSDGMRVSIPVPPMDDMEWLRLPSETLDARIDGLLGAVTNYLKVRGSVYGSGVH